MQILISSVSAQNPPVLLPPKRVCPLPICPSRRCRSQPLPGVSRKQRYNTLDFPTENRVPRKALPSFGNLPPKGTLFPSGLPACPCSGYPPCSHTMDAFLPEQVKQAQNLSGWWADFCACFCSAASGETYMEPSVLVGDFRIGVRKTIVPSPHIWYNKTVEFSDGGIPHGHLV